MPSLTHLAFKLCPEPESTVIDDELKLALGHIDVNDAWMEFDTAYKVIAHTVIYLTPMGASEAQAARVGGVGSGLGLGHGARAGIRLGQGKLEEFRVDDIKMEGIRENLEDLLEQRLQKWWAYGGGGVWRRKGRSGRGGDGEEGVGGSIQVA
jgi:hypothetical protein